MIQPTYEDALRWLAHHDVDRGWDCEHVCVILVADLWGLTPARVAEDFARVRDQPS